MTADRRNASLIADFEQGRAPGDFHHADHVRVAFAYVSEFPLLEAIAKFSAALKRFALAKGKPHLYHETITWAYLLLIHERLARAEFSAILPSQISPSLASSSLSAPALSLPSHTWEEFSERNADLFVWKGGVIDRYYSQTTLDSELARQTFVFPDRHLSYVSTGTQSLPPVASR